MIFDRHRGLFALVSGSARKWRVFMASVASVDGTTIDYDIAGSGPVIVFVAGVFNLRDTFTPLAAELSSDHTVLTYDRRGRGESSDTAPYSIEREVEDLQAIIEVAGSSASVFGYSSGAILALKAVADGVAVERLYLYEPPFRFDENQPAPPADLPARLQALLDAGDPGAVVATFQIEWVGLPQEVVNDAQRSPMWAQLEAMAQSAVYDAVITTDLQRPTAQMAAVSTPTLVLQGDPTWPVLATAAAGIARRLPNATHRILPVEAVHGIDPGGTAAAIREFEQ
jgi:pimeloyl-ACP methyl ester carboxylesterase